MDRLDYRYDKIKDINDYGSNIQKYIQLSQITHYYKLNSQSSVGNISYLIGQKDFKTSKEWIRYYLTTGEESFKGRSEGSVDETLFGRTKQEVVKLVEKLYTNIQQDTYLIESEYPLLKDITFKQCYDSFTFLILGHSWNGMIVRENNVIASLQREEYLDEYTFEKSNPEQDLKYGIDIIVKKGSDIVAGIQVKPKKYLKHNMRISDYAKKQHANFIQYFGAKRTAYIYADDNGVIDDNGGNNMFYVD